MRNIWRCIICLDAVLALTGCQAQSETDFSGITTANADESYEDTRELMGTVVMVRAYGQHAEDGVNAAFQRAEELEQIFSTTIDNTELNQVNKAAKAGEAVTLSDDCFQVVKAAMDFGRLTNGALDCTMGDLIDLWGIGTDHAAVPSQENIDALLRENGWQDVTLDETTQTVTFEDPAVTLHLGAIAKGYISDAMKETLEETGVTSAIMSLGGNVMTLGSKPDNSRWTVAVTDPFSPDELIATLKVSGQAVVTSGNYERYFEEDGVRYHHILDPSTGFPSDSDVVSTTIISDCGMNCDALSTATIILGAEKGMALINRMDGTEAVFIKTDGTILTSDHMAAYDLQEIGT